MRRFVLLIAFALAYFSLAATNDTIINGLKYTPIENTTTVSVSAGNNDNIPSNLIIPETVVFGGVEYTVSVIGNAGFSGNNNLVSVTLPATVVSIENQAFIYCSNLISVVIPVNSQLQNIGATAFFGCSTLQIFAMPERVKTIGDNAFWGDMALQNMHVPDSVVSIGNYAFFGVYIDTLTIPASCTSVGLRAFGNITGSSPVSRVKHVFYNAVNASWATNTNRLFSDSLLSIVFGEGVEVIPDYICKGTNRLVEPVNLPSSLKKVGQHAFEGCYGFSASLILPDGIDTIGDYAFANCAWGGKITVPASVRYLGESCLLYDTLIIESDSLTLGENALSNDGVVYMNTVNPPVLTGGQTQGSGDQLSISAQNMYIYIPCGTKDNYCQAFGWDSLCQRSATAAQAFFEEEGYWGYNTDMVDDFRIIAEKYTKVEGVQSCDSFVWGGNVYDSTGVYWQTYTTADGCDSIVTLLLTVNYSSLGDVTEVVACGSYEWYDSTYTQTGEYTHTLTNAVGCDSLVTLRLTVYQSSTDITSQVACDSLTYDGVTYYESVYLIDTLTNSYGCDSIVALQLTINHSVTSDTTVIACESFDWFDSTYTQSGDYTQILTNAFGCDSVVTLHLTIGQESHNVEYLVACNGYGVEWNGEIYSDEGVYTYEYVNATGCASVDTLYLTEGQSSMGDTLPVTACESFLWYDSTYYQTGYYIHVLTSGSGCDSIVTLNLTVNHGTHNVEYASACESYVWHDQTFTESNVYTYSYTNAAGCDSEDTLHLLIKPIPEVDSIYGDLVVCQNQYAVYEYPIDTEGLNNYTYSWYVQDSLVGVNVNTITLYWPYHLVDSLPYDTMKVITMRVRDDEAGCEAETEITVRICEHHSPDTTVIMRKPNSSNMLLCREVSSTFGTVHYQWGYTEIETGNEVAFTWDHPYYQYDHTLDMEAYRYWVETYIVYEDFVCRNRTYYVEETPVNIDAYGDDFSVLVYRQNGQCHLKITNSNMHKVAGGMYDISGRLLQSLDYGNAPAVEQTLDYNFARGVYILVLSADGKSYTTKISW